MSKTVNLQQAKANFSRLIAEVEAGGEVTIARAGKPIAKLVPLPKTKKHRPDRKPGFLRGKIKAHRDFDDPLPHDILAAFRGDVD